jgi:hypothetical protein
MELEDSGFPETPLAVNVTGALVTPALEAAVSVNVCGEPIPTVAEPGATPTPEGRPLNTSVMLPAESFSAATWKTMLVVPPCVMLTAAG